MTMQQEIAPIAVRPSTLSGISEQAVVSHYENDYGSAVRTLNAVRRELAALDAGTPPYRLRGLKREELSLMGSVALHELYFGNLGGFRRAGPNSGLGRPDWHEVPDTFAAEIAADFGSASAWRREFVGTAQSLAGCSAWVLLTYSRRQQRFWNQIATDDTQVAVDAAPVLVLDMYEHAYQMDYGVNATAYIDTFFRNINWEAVLKRIEAARNNQPLPNEDPSSTTDVPSLSVEELAAEIANSTGVQIVDARQRDHMSRHVDLMAGATWRDPDRVGEWIAELKPDKPVSVYCSYGFDVGRNVAKTLIERGFDARFIRGGLAAWYASGGARALRPTAG
jgi:Fe-Mn family superoxide dismutase